MKRVIAPAVMLALFAGVAFADFPKEVTIGEKTIPLYTVKEMRDLGFAVEDIPWEQNAARVYIEAMNAYRPPAKKLWDDQDFKNAQRDFDLDRHGKEIEPFLKDNAKALKLLAEADRMPKCAWPTDKSGAMPMGVFAFFGQSGLYHALDVRASWSISQGDIAAGVDDLFLCLRMGRRFADNRDMLNWMAGHAIETLALSRLDALVATGWLKDMELQRLATRLQALRPDNRGYLAALERDRAWELLMVRIQAETPRALVGMPGLPPLPVDTAGFRRETELNVNAIYDWREKMARLPACEAYRPENSWDAYKREHETHWDLMTEALNTKIPLPFELNLGKWRQPGDLLAVYYDVLLTRIALERYSLANGKYPDTLNALVPKFLGRVPLDPFSGKPFRYKPVHDGKRDGFVLWSIGVDLKDDGGVCGKPWRPDIRITEYWSPCEPDGEEDDAI